MFGKYQAMSGQKIFRFFLPLNRKMPFLEIEHAGTGTRNMSTVLSTEAATRHFSLIDLAHSNNTGWKSERVVGLANTTVTDFRKKNESKWIIQVDNPPINVKLMRAKRARWTRFDFNWIDCEILFIQTLKNFWILDYGKSPIFENFNRTLYSITCQSL